MVYYEAPPLLVFSLCYLTISSAHMCALFISLIYFVVCWTFRFLSIDTISIPTIKLYYVIFRQAVYTVAETLDYTLYTVYK